jgi:hypothetical protein
MQFGGGKVHYIRYSVIENVTALEVSRKFPPALQVAGLGRAGKAKLTK